ncbi:hypothetical protein [Azospirillum largimobile]
MFDLLNSTADHTHSSATPQTCFLVIRAMRARRWRDAGPDGTA